MFIKPCEGRITSRFSQLRKDPIGGGIRPHKGVDFGGDESAIIIASEKGSITRAKVIGGYGNAITIAHVINGKKYETLYAHLKSFSVKVGQIVKQGQPIGIKGTTGSSTAIHLHFEIHVPSYAAGQPNAANPLYYIYVPEVVEIQKLLVAFGYKLTIDGIEGPLTQIAIKAFQKEKGITADGIPGPVTLEALKKAITSKGVT